VVEKVITDIIEKYRKNPYGETFSMAGIEHVVAGFVSQREQIVGLFPGCHGKVNHPDLTFDHMPDLSEYLCTEKLKKMCAEISAVYSPGIKILMVHEGHFYVDTALISSDAEMDQYVAKIREMIGESSCIESLALRDFFKQAYSNDMARADFLKTYCPSDDEIYGLIAKDVYMASLLKHYYTRIFDNFRGIYDREYKSAFNAYEDFCKDQATAQLRIWVGFRRMLMDKLGHKKFIRFSSVYKDPSVLDQVALNYIPNHHLEMPSFNCVVRLKSGEYAYLTRKEALARGYKVSTMSGYRYFEEVA
jgi:hypothetical protein